MAPTRSLGKSVFSKAKPKKKGSQSLHEYLNYLDIAGAMYNEEGSVRTPDASGPSVIHNVIDGDRLFSSDTLPNIDDLDLSFLDLGPTDAQPGQVHRKRRRPRSESVKIRTQVPTCPTGTETTSCPSRSTHGTGNGTDSSSSPARGEDEVSLTQGGNHPMYKRSRTLGKTEGNPRSAQESHNPSEKTSGSRIEEIPRRPCPFSGRTRYLPPSIDILPAGRPSIEEIYRRVPEEAESDDGDIECIGEFPPSRGYDASGSIQ